MTRELITQMLECIEELRYSGSTFSADRRSSEAIFAAREYLAQPESEQEPVAFKCGSYYYPWPSEDAHCDQAHKHVLLYVAPQPSTPEPVNQSLLDALKSVWLWMENQADGQSKGSHATFDLMMLREQRDIARAAIAQAEQV